jgi:hypothetical protein
VRTPGVRSSHPGGGAPFPRTPTASRSHREGLLRHRSAAAIAEAAPGKVIFKGGTSLSKGWNLIERFSEDIDLFLDPRAFEPPLGKKGVDRELKRLRDAVESDARLTFSREGSLTIGGFGRRDFFTYEQRFGGPGEVAGRVLLEAGTASGREPTEIRQLRSHLSEFLANTRRSLGATDEVGFDMPLLHFRRTFVEKLFAIHAKVEIVKRDGAPLGSYARHYYDLSLLARTDEVRAMLRGDEYGHIKADYDTISREHFSRDYFPPPGMSFATSDALFPVGALAASLGLEYERQCRQLCYGRYPSWREVLDQFGELRELL